MRFAVVRDNHINDVIIANEEQKQELEVALNAKLVDASPLGLSIGDLLVNGKWTRNQSGEQVVLTECATYDELLAYINELEATLNDYEE